MAATMLPSLEINSWTEKSLSDFTINISNVVSRPLILIDGVGGSGKTTLAVKIADKLNANLVHSDDVCWYTDPIRWDGEMLDGIVNPWLNKKNVAYRPTGWVKESRPGSIDVDPNKALVIEGMGASRKTLRAIATYSIWVDTEPDVARNRVIQRDLADGLNGGTLESVTQFTDWWDSLVIPFLLEEKPWKYVDIIVSGSQSDLVSNNLAVHVPGVYYG
jgi:uridine kinase